MRTVIVACGKLGSTLEAGLQIQENVLDNLDLFNGSLKPKINFSDYDQVVFGTNIIMGKLNKQFVNYLKQFLKCNQNQKCFVYVSCLANTDEGKNKYLELVQKYLDCEVYFVGGKLNLEKAKGLTKMMIKMIIKTEYLNKNLPLPDLDIKVIKELSDRLK